VFPKTILHIKESIKSSSVESLDHQPKLNPIGRSPLPGISKMAVAPIHETIQDVSANDEERRMSYSKSANTLDVTSHDEKRMSNSKSSITLNEGFKALQKFLK
jgi:hypothetical protein